MFLMYFKVFNNKIIAFMLWSSEPYLFRFIIVMVMIANGRI